VLRTIRDFIFNADAEAAKPLNFIAVIYVRKVGGSNYIEVNSVISLYPKDSAGRVVKWFDSEKAQLTEKGEKPLLEWADKEKAFRWLADHSSNVNAVGLSPKRIANIIQKSTMSTKV
jgi:hypothetical protein